MLFFFLTGSASIKGVSCQDKYKAVLLETFNVKVMLHAVLSIFLIFTSYHCDPRNEMNSEEFEEVVESSGSSPEVGIFTVSKLNQYSLYV